MLLQALADLLQHFLFVGELAGLKLGVDEFVAHGEFKAASHRRLQLQRLDLAFVLAQNPGRQTDGLRLVVSGRAVAKMDSHKGHLLSEWPISFRWCESR